jgi:ribonuclease VapC
MVIDTSAVVAILFDEPDRSAITAAIELADARRMSAATFVEVSIVVEARYGPAGRQELDLLLEHADVEVVPVDAGQARAARQAWSRFGKGRHPAALNLGDCFSYALAATEAQPLLCKGDDFRRTDIAIVPLPDEN